MLAFKYGLDWATADQDVAELAARLKPVVRKDTKAAPASSGSVLDMFKK